MTRRQEAVRRRLADERGGRVVLLSHCLLDQNVRYPGGATRVAGVEEVVDGYLAQGIGIHQLPCPERRAWGGPGKPALLWAFGSGGTWRARASRRGVGVFVLWTRAVYARLARSVARDVAGYQRAGCQVVGVVGVAGSPSCGVGSTLQLGDAVGTLTRCPLADLDRRTVDEDVIAAHTRPGSGLFVLALRRRLRRAGPGVPFGEVDLAERPARVRPATPREGDAGGP